MLEYLNNLDPFQIYIIIASILFVMIVANIFIFSSSNKNKNKNITKKSKKQKNKKKTKEKKQKDVEEKSKNISDKNQQANVSSKYKFEDFTKQVEEEPVTFRNLFEQQQEDNSVISYNELLDRAKKERVSDDDIRIRETLDDRLIQELERNTSMINFDLGEEFEPFVEEKFEFELQPKLEEVPYIFEEEEEIPVESVIEDTIDEENEPIEETLISEETETIDLEEKKNFQASAFISPIHGMDRHTKEAILNARMNSVARINNASTSLDIDDLVDELEGINADIQSTMETIQNMKVESNVENKSSQLDYLDHTLEFNFDTIPNFQKLRRTRTDSQSVNVNELRNEIENNREFLNDLITFRKSLEKKK